MLVAILYQFVLQLVRMTNAPENAGSVVVVNLSWLSTTDWLVAYSNQEMTTSGTFMLSIKKVNPSLIE